MLKLTPLNQLDYFKSGRYGYDVTCMFWTVYIIGEFVCEVLYS